MPINNQTRARHAQSRASPPANNPNTKMCANKSSIKKAVFSLFCTNVLCYFVYFHTAFRIDFSRAGYGEKCFTYIHHTYNLLVSLFDRWFRSEKKLWNFPRTRRQNRMAMEALSLYRRLAVNKQTNIYRNESTSTPLLFLLLLYCMQIEKIMRQRTC